MSRPSRSPKHLPRRRRAPSRAARLYRRAADLVPWTPLGFLLGAAGSVAVLYYAFEKLDLVLLVFGYGAMALLGLVTAFTFATTVALDVHLRRRARAGSAPSSAEGDSRLALETGRWQRGTFTLPALRWLPLVRARWEWERPLGFETDVETNLGTARERVRARHRGEHVGVRRRIVVEDVFGLTRLALRSDDPVVVEVLPHLGGLRRLPTLLAFSGGADWPHPMGLDEGDRMELRRYAPGDPARFIHWKIYGRTRKLVVRMPERALERAERTIGYFATGPSDEASAAAARVAVETGALGEGWAFAADGAGGSGRVADARLAIARSAAHEGEAGAGLEAFVRAEERKGPVALVLFVPPAPGPWIERVLPTLSARRGRTRVVIGVDGLSPGGAAAWWRRALVRARPSEATAADALDEVLSKLSSARADVVVVDRGSGRVLTAALRRAALVAKEAA